MKPAPIGIVVILVSLSFIINSCTSLVFQPTQIQYIDPDKNNIQFQDVYFETENQLTLNGWFLPSRKSYSHGTILFAHGNAQNISAHINSVYWLPYSAFNVFIFDYQGYGKSAGQPSLSGVQQDFHAALNWLIDNPEVDNNKIIIFGQSLGAAIALHAIAESKHKNSIRGIIADSSFTRYQAITRDILNNTWLTWAFQWPLSFLISDEFPPIEAVPKISPIPLLIIHSKQDEVIPYYHGVSLYNAAKEPKYFWSLDEIRHIQIFSNEDNRKTFVEYLLSMLKNTFPDK